MATLNKRSIVEVRNHIINLLPSKDREHLLPHLKPVSLTKGQLVYGPREGIRYVYFPEDGLVSLVSMTDSGQTIEVGMVGSEGIVGLPVIWKASSLPYQVIVQIPGQAWRVRADVFRREFDRCGKLQAILLRYTSAAFTQVSQTVVCNRFHTIEERLCRWLLMSCDLAKSENLALTQEILSVMLGATRTLVTETAGALQKARLISYQRGQIQILDRQKMEEVSCECYPIIRDAFSHFLETNIAAVH